MLATLAGCSEYLDRRDNIALSGGNAVASDKVTHMVDPWPRDSADRNIAFDGNKMDSFLTFEDQIEAYFTRYESFRVTLRIIQTSMENDRGIILAEFQLENTPRGGGRISRRQGQLRFELEPSPKGWKIVDFNPRGFFS